MRGGSSHHLAAGDWSDETAIGDDGLGLDSLEQLGALGALAETFLLGDGLLPETPPARVGDWLDWVERGRQAGPNSLMVRTSGSTGAPKTCRHPVESLVEEAGYFATQFVQCRRVIALVPASHLYGLIWTVLLPASLGIPVVDRALGSPLALMPGDLVVAVPEQWGAFVRMKPAVPIACVAVSSAGVLTDSMAVELRAAGFSRVVDVYGSSETGAIAMRDAPSAGYELLPRWELLAGDDDVQIVDREGLAVPLPDHVEQLGPRHLRPVRRRDRAVKIGGLNVWPDRVAAVLRETDGVADIAVRLGENGRLKAFVVESARLGPAELLTALERVAAQRLSAVERPKSYSFGAQLPGNEMGKPADWD